MTKGFKNAEPMWVFGFVLLVMLVVCVSGCNTIAGIGEDITGAANGIGRAIRDDYKDEE